MSTRVVAVLRSRRLLTALLVAAFTCGLTVALASWPRPAASPVAAAQPSVPPPGSETGGPDGVASAAPSGGLVAGVPSSDQDPDGPPATRIPEPAPVATAAPPFEVAVVPEALDQRLDARLKKLRAKYSIPGVSATIILADGSTWTGTSGYANVRKRTKVQPDTAFALASVSKTYTSALILALADEGRLDLDARVSKLLPRIRFTGKATVRQLLDHTSGIPDYFRHAKIDQALLRDRDRVWTAADSFRYVGKPIFAAGKGWYYSNTNYTLLAMIAESIDGRPLAAQVRERFLDPLGLGETYDQIDESPPGPTAHGYRVTGQPSKPVFTDLSDGTRVMPYTSLVSAALGAGSMAATSADAARWARALYAGDALPRATVREMIRDARSTARFHPRVDYGLGVQVTRLDGRTAVGHSGRLTGFRSLIRYLPDEGITIAVLTNEASTDPTVIARALLRIVSPPAPAPSPSGN